MSAALARKARLRTSAAYAAPARAANDVRQIALPHRAAMASRYGAKVAHLPVFAGPAVAAALKKRGAEGAALDGAIFLPDGKVAADLVAHEVVHALQQPMATGDGEAFLARLETATEAPAKSPVENEAGVLSRSEGAPDASPILHSLPAGVVALRRAGSGTPASDGHAPFASQQAPAASEQAAPTGPGAAGPTQQSNEGAAAGSGAPGAAQAAGGESDIAPTFTPAALPENALDPAVEAEREAAKAEAEAALANADSPSAVMDAYAGMAPSVKALNSADLGTRVADTSTSSTQDLEAGTPEITARLSGEEGNLPAPPPIALPGEQAGEAPPQLADPDIAVPDGPAQPELRTDPGYGSFLERFFGGGASPESVGEQLDDVSTRNPGVETQITDRADVPLEGATDPAQMDTERDARGAEAANARGEAANAVVTGPGPEAVAPREMEHSVEVAAPTPETQALPQPEGAGQLNQMTLPGEVVAQFDADTGPAMAENAQAARASMETAETDRDTAHETAVQQAETDRAAAEQAADTQQRDTIVTNREAIQSERQRTVDQQQAEVDRVNSEAETARADHREQADRRVADDRSAISDHYDQAETDSQAEVSRGENRAEDERAQAERESENQSWWDRATSFIKRAFEALTSAINAIFDAVRSAVAAIIDAVVSVVTAIIEAAAAALKALVSAFGELLKGLIDGLLGEIFPELAAALTQFIDEAVSAVNEAIDAVADALVSAVEAVGAALNAAINALLDLYQNAINGALALLEAAMTGDWGALLLKVLDAILELLGIDPTAFHAMIAQASDAVDTIVNDPMGFVTNLIDAVVGGISQFADNFGTHLRDGLIGWLTGALGGITLPERWDIWGVLDIARQILGLTWDFVRERAANIIGEANVARLEAVFSWIGTLVTEGWGGLWNRIMGELESLKDTVMSAIRDFILERVIMGAIRWLASLFSPVGAIVQLVMTIWNVYQFVSNQLQRLFGIAQAVVEGISNIAHGVLGPAMNKVEEVLGNLVPVVIDLLMSLLGVTGVAARVREIIGNIRAAIARAVDNLLQRVLGALGLGRGGGAAGAEGEAEAGTGEIGAHVPIDVAEGPDHTLQVDRSGQGHASAVIHSDPTPAGRWIDAIAALPVDALSSGQRSAKTRKINEARAALGELDTKIAQRLRQESDPNADFTAIDAEIATAERALTVPVKYLFDNFETAGSPNLLAAFPELENPALEASVKRAITAELRAGGDRYIAVRSWDALADAMMGTVAPFDQPLLSASRAFNTANRTEWDGAVAAALAAGTPEQRGLGATVDHNAARSFAAEHVRAGSSQGTDYSQLHRQYVARAFHVSGYSASALSGALAAVIRHAFTHVSQRGAQADAEVRGALGEDPARGAVRRDGNLNEAGNALDVTSLPQIINLLRTVAHGGSTQVNGVTINEAWFEEKWRNPANAAYIKDRFRAAFPNQHEWIPSNFLLNVLNQAGTARTQGEEAGETAALLIDVYHTWRTPTVNLIYKASYSGDRHITVNGQSIVIAQGHSGAVYAPVDSSNVVTGRSQPQTEKQNIWHDALRAHFLSHTSISESRAFLESVISDIEEFVNETIWRGSGGFSPWTGYTDASGAPKSFAALRAQATGSTTQIAADFARAKGIIG